jgi:hypothetical protein
MYCVLCTKEIEDEELTLFNNEPYHIECLNDYDIALKELKSIYEEFEEDSSREVIDE